MKKILIIVFGFFVLLSNAQDTIIFKNNPAPVICTIRSVTQTNIFYIYNGEYLSDYMANVKYYSKPYAQPKPNNPSIQPISQAQPSTAFPAQPNTQIQSHKPDIFNPKGYISLSLGGGFPLRKYKDSGYAITGVNLSLCGVKPFNNSKLGVALKLDYGSNSVDQEALAAGFQNGFQSSSFLATIVSVGNFTYTSALGGLCVMFPGQDFTFEIRGLGGLMFANLPAVNINVFYNSSTAGTISEPAASATAFCFDLGAGFRYEIMPELSANAYFDFMYSNPNFPVSANSVIQTNSGPQVLFSSGNVSQVFELANVTFGIAWTPLKAASK